MEHTYLTEPYAHQRTAFDLSHDKTAFALLMEMRTGKSKVIIDTASFLWKQGKIDLLLVVAPNLVHRQWVDTEVPRHCPSPFVAVAWQSSWTPNKQERALAQLEAPGKLVVFTINYEATISQRGKVVMKQLMDKFCTMLVLDESHRIKTPSAKQTRTLLGLAKYAKYRRILTGTPITQGPLDVFTQFNFLDESILNCGSFYAFKNRYAVWEKQYAHGRSFNALVRYQNQDDLTRRTREHSFRVTAQECLDLPPRQYSRLTVSLTTKQRRIYDDLVQNLIAELDGEQITAPLALTKLLRLQQITGGFFPTDEETIWIDDPVRRVTEMTNYVQDIPGKVIIWARFRAELDHLLSALAGYALPIHGGVPTSNRVDNLALFQDTDSKFKYLVANPAVAGEGLDLRVADTMIFYSCSFKLTERLQAEARCDFPGRKIPVSVVDMVAEKTVDEHVLARLKSKHDLAANFTGDELRSWLT